MDYKRTNEEYFKKHREKLMLNFFFNKRSIVLVIILALLTIGLGFGAYYFADTLIHYIFGFATAIALLFFILGTVRVFNSQIDEVVVEGAISDARNIAYQDLYKTLAINNRKDEYIEDPLEFINPDLYPGRNTILYRFVRKSGKVYYSQTRYDWILFGEKNLFHYGSSINHIYGFVGFEVADEVAYTDIVNVKTTVKRITKNFHVYDQLVLNISLVDAREIEVIIRNRVVKKDHGSTLRIDALEEQVLKKLRLAIRNNK